MGFVPPRHLETLVGWLIPPACREPVLGDMRERHTNLRGYLSEAMSTVPWVVLNRIRRTAEPEVLLMEAFVLYLSFLGILWISGRSAMLYEPLGFIRVAIPAAVVLCGLVLVDAYADPRQQRFWKPMLETAMGIGCAFLSEGVLATTHPDLVLPFQILLLGSLLSLLLLCALRVYFGGQNPRPLS